MEISIFKVTKKANTFFATRRGANLEDVLEPLTLEVSDLTLFKELTIATTDEPRIAFDAKAAFESITAHGYYFFSAGVKIEVEEFTK